MATSFTKEDKRTLIDEYRHHESDSGSPEVQIAILTKRIRYLTDHLGKHKKDHATRRGLLMLVGKRSKLLRYVHRKDAKRYQGLIRSLGIRK